MIDRPPLRPTSSLLSETLHVGVSFDTKRALTEAARRAGKPVAALVREAVEEAVERTAPTSIQPRADR